MPRYRSASQLIGWPRARLLELSVGLYKYSNDASFPPSFFLTYSHKAPEAWVGRKWDA